MAAPAYATDLTDIVSSFSTGWSLVSEGGGGQNAITSPETDDFIQGTECVSRNPFSSSIRGIAYEPGATVSVAAGDAVFVWWKADVAQALNSFASGGVHVLLGSSLTAYEKFYVAGNDTYQLGGWRCSPIDPAQAQSATRGSPGSPPWDTFGVAFDVPASGPSKGFPFKVDMIRHGRQIEVTQGDSGTPATWDALTAYADATARRWAIVQGTPTGAQQQGIVYWGTASTACYSRDTARAIVFLDTLGFTATDFTQLIFANASTDVEWDGMSFLALGSANKGIITVQNNASVSITNSTVQDIGVTNDGGSNSTWDGTKWIGCDQVIAAGGSFLGCTIQGSTVAANTSALLWNIATDPAGLLNDATFTKGAAAHHAIEFGTSSPTTINLTGLTFTGFSASNNQNDSVLHIKRTAGTVTINLSNVTGTVSYRTDGATVVLVSANQLELTGLQNPTEVRVYDAGTTTEVAGQENVTSGTFSTSIDAATYPNVDIALISLGYQITRLENISMSTDRSIPVSQVIDRQYDNP